MDHDIRKLITTLAPGQTGVIDIDGVSYEVRAMSDSEVPPVLLALHSVARTWGHDWALLPADTYIGVESDADIRRAYQRQRSADERPYDFWAYMGPEVTTPRAYRNWDGDVEGEVRAPWCTVRAESRGSRLYIEVTMPDAGVTAWYRSGIVGLPSWYVVDAETTTMSSSARRVLATAVRPVDAESADDIGRGIGPDYVEVG